MSTLYRITGRGRRLTYDKVKQLCTYHGFTLRKNKGNLLVETPVGFVHVYKNGKSSYNLFERFGANSVTHFVAALEYDFGYSFLSEHDDGF